MRKALVTTVVVGLLLAGVLVASQVILPRILEQRLAGAIASLVPEHQELAVEIASFPALRLLGGWLDGIGIDLVHPHIQGLTFEWMALRGDQVLVDVAALQERRLVVRQARSIDIEVAMGETELARYLQSRLPQVSDVQVELEADSVTVQGLAVVLGRPIRASVIGHVEPVESTRIRFVPHNVTVEQQAVPEVLVQAARTLWEWELDLAFLPFEVHVDSIDVTNGLIIAKGAWDEGR